MTFRRHDIRNPVVAWQSCFSLATPHGIVTGVALPPEPTPVPDEVLARLHPDERVHALTLRGYRQGQWVAGRLALHQSIRRLNGPPVPLLTDAHGAVTPPPGMAVSVSHKADLAVGLADHARGATLGVDLENTHPERLHLAPRLLTPPELSTLEPLQESRRWLAVLLRFIIKEAIYKALHPHVLRFVGFQEAEVRLNVNGTAEVHLNLDPPAGPFHVDARYTWLTDRVMATVRLQPASSKRPEPEHRTE